jgi:hypothetical protein
MPVDLELRALSAVEEVTGEEEVGAFAFGFGSGELVFIHGTTSRTAATNSGVFLYRAMACQLDDGAI